MIFVTKFVCESKREFSDFVSCNSIAQQYELDGNASIRLAKNFFAKFDESLMSWRVLQVFDSYLEAVFH